MYSLYIVYSFIRGPFPPGLSKLELFAIVDQAVADGEVKAIFKAAISLYMCV